MSERKTIIGLLLALVLMAGLSAYYVLFTSKGGEMAIRYALSRHASNKDIDFESLAGNLVHGVTFDNIVLNNLEHLPQATSLKIQRVFVGLTSWGMAGLTVDVENARLFLPDSDPVVLAGALKNKNLDFNVYSKGLSLQNILSYFPRMKDPPFKVAGTINDIDLYIKGEYAAPAVTGKFVVDEAACSGLVLKGSEGWLDLNWKNLNRDVRLFGRVRVKGGTIESNRVLVKLDDNKINFSGEPENPSLDLSGSSRIDKTDINIILKGTPQEPDLQLSSDPILPREMLMLMLATGKSWTGLEESLDEKTVSPKLTKDFIDYFLFAGKGNSFARHFGLSELTVDYNKENKGIAAKKQLTDRLEVGYGVNQQMDEGQGEVTTQKLQSEIKVSDKVSLDLESDIKQNTTPTDPLAEPQDESSNVDNKIFLKYQKSF